MASVVAPVAAGAWVGIPSRLQVLVANRPPLSRVNTRSPRDRAGVMHSRSQWVEALLTVLLTCTIDCRAACYNVLAP